MKKTSLHKKHLEQKARMVPFAGWEMPIQYSSIIKEHNSVRKQAGLFDISHMGKIVLKGAHSLPLLQHLTCNNVEKINVGQAQYNIVLNNEGGVVDDILIYRTEETSFFVVSNAANHDAVYSHLQNSCESMELSIEISDETTQWQQIAIQGPQAQNILSDIIQEDLSHVAYFYFTDLHKHNHPFRISRTGYTGEDGFEVYAKATSILWLWDRLMEKAKKEELLPVGLGARDILRLESLYPLYGNELKEKWTPIESGLAWCVKTQNPPYLGYEKIMEHKVNGAPGKVMGFSLEEDGLARNGCNVWNEDGGKNIGQVLSAAYSPVRKKGIGTVYLPNAYKENSKVQIEIRNKKQLASLQNEAFIQRKAGRMQKTT